MPRKKQKDLVLVNLRLRKKDIETARKKAADLGIPYQHVIRAWVAEQAKASN